MNVRLQLIAGFVIIALLVLALFGLIAHRTALTVNHTQADSIAYEIVKDHAEVLGKVGIEQQLTSEFSIRLPLKHSEDMLFALTDQEGHLLAISSDDQALNTLIQQFPFKQALKHPDNSGSYQIDEQRFSWTKATVPDHPYQLFLLHEQDPSLPNFSAELGRRMLVTAFMIIWLAIWVALIASKRIVHKLDQQNAAILHQALFDDLTDLPNRRQLIDKLHSGIKEHQRIALMMLDLNNLRDVNETLGHQAGDQLVKLAAVRIQKCLSNAEVVARLGGDEFAIAIEVRSADQAEQMANSLAHYLSRPIVLGNLEVISHASIGYAIYPDHAENASNLMKRAEVALHYAKQERLTTQLYTAEIDPYSLKLLTLMANLRQAIDEGQLVAYYQPKIDLKTNTIGGVESLVRWVHPKQGMIPPDEFIYLAEKCNLIDKLTLWVVEESIRQCHEWLQTGYTLQVAVNLSTRNLHNAALPKQIGHLLEKWRLPARLLKLEITEGSIMSDPETALETLLNLHNMGIQLSVDDFGTGYSSLSYLKRLPIAELKIDRSFVMDMLQNENDEIIVRSTIDMAHSMGFTVVAEGIEDEATLQRLVQLECDTGQGFYISRPVPALDLAEWLKSSPWPTRA